MSVRDLMCTSKEKDARTLTRTRTPQSPVLRSQIDRLARKPTFIHVPPPLGIVALQVDAPEPAVDAVERHVVRPAGQHIVPRVGHAQIPLVHLFDRFPEGVFEGTRPVNGEKRIRCCRHAVQAVP